MENEDQVTIESLRGELQVYGLEVLENRIDRLLTRRFVFFPMLRVFFLLRKLRKLQTL